MDFDEEDNNNQQEGDDVQEDDIFGFADDVSVQDMVSKRDAVFFLVDCKAPLFQTFNGDDQTQLGKVLDAFRQFLKSKIISNVDDKIGLILFNVKKASNPLQFHGINLVYNLESPSADRIRDVVGLEQAFEQEFGLSTEEAVLHECLWLCNHEFKCLEKNKFSMRIFMFTCEDNPTFKDQNSKDQTIKHARQLKDMDVQIEVFPLYKKEGHQFDVSRFYQEIITIDLDEVNNTVLDASAKIMDLKQRVKQKEYRKRALNRLLMDVGDDMQVGLKVFCQLNKAKKPLGKPVEKKTNSILKKKTQFVCVDTGNPLFPNQIGTYFPLGKEKVILSKEQMAQIKGFEKPGMRLIGFKPLSTLKDYHNYRASYFVYPDDEHVNGSSQFFDALITQMNQKQKIAIVRLVPRAGSTVRFVAMIPQPEQYDEDHFQRPPGLHMIFLPYADDIRGLDTVKSEGREVSRELLNIGKIMVNSLTLQNFDCANFEDPSIQKFFAHLQAHALREINIDEPQDLLQPDHEGMEKYKDVVNLFMQAVDLECTGPEPKKRAPKKEIDEGESPPKRGRGRGRGRAKSEMEEDFIEDVPVKRGRGRARKVE